MQFNRAKLRAVVLHACKSCPPENLGAVKLHKILYFSDMINYAESGNSITGSNYIKRPHGPTNERLIYVLNEMARSEDIQVTETDYYGFRKKQYTALSAEPEDVLSGSELSLIDDVIEFVCLRNSAKTISDYSHNRAWEMAEYGEVIPYRRAFLLFPSDISPEAIELADKGAKEIAAAKSGNRSVAFTDFGVFRSRLQPSRL